MKRRVLIEEEEGGSDSTDEKLKKKNKIFNEEEEEDKNEGFSSLSDDLLFEVLKFVDAKSLATSACVNQKLNKLAKDERLWELICTHHWANVGCGTKQLRSVVLALGGFRRLHSLYIRPLLKSPSSSSLTTSSFPTSVISSSSSSSRTTMIKKTPNWGKDEVHLSLSLLSIRYYEMMNLTNTKGSSTTSDLSSSSSSSSAAAAADELRKGKMKD